MKPVYKITIEIENAPFIIRRDFIVDKRALKELKELQELASAKGFTIKGFGIDHILDATAVLDELATEKQAWF